MKCIYCDTELEAKRPMMVCPICGFESAIGYTAHAERIKRNLPMMKVREPYYVKVKDKLKELKATSDVTSYSKMVKNAFKIAYEIDY